MRKRTRSNGLDASRPLLLDLGGEGRRGGVYGQNLLKTDYATALFSSGSGLFRTPGAPRTFGVTVGYRYDGR